MVARPVLEAHAKALAKQAPQTHKWMTTEIKQMLCQGQQKTKTA